jgi:hypothetical protein
MGRNDPSSSQKWEITFFSGLIFLIVVNPYTYKLTNALFSGIVGPTARNGCPTSIGLFIHTLVYLLLVRYSMDLKLFR